MFNDINLQNNAPYIQPQARKHVNVNTQASCTIDTARIGQEQNAFGTGFGAKTQLWYDPKLNATTMVHRTRTSITGDLTSGWYRYDVSSNGGWTWMSNVGPLYSSNGTNAPVYANARYPQAMILNPATNVNNIFDSAFVSYYGPSLTSVNAVSSGTGWGGHVHGRGQFNTLSFTQAEDVKTRFLIPDGGTMSQNGTVYISDGEWDGTTAYPPAVYTDSIWIGKGVYNPITRDMVYTDSYNYVPMAPDNQGRPLLQSTSIAFAADNLTGYLAMLGRTNFTINQDSSNYIVVYKTTNGGTTWTGPMDVPLNGVDGLLTNSGLPYTTGFQMDCVVDTMKNLHVVIAIGELGSQGFSITTAYGHWGIFDVWTPDGGTNWNACLLRKPETFRGVFGIPNDANNPEIDEDSRQQASCNWNMSKLFFSWFETDSTLGVGNQDPNMWSIGYDVKNNKWTTAKNFTANTIADASVVQAEVSYYVKDSSGTYIIPFEYSQFSNSDPTQTGVGVQLVYVKGACFNNTQFTATGNCVNLTGVDELAANGGMLVSQNYPNPCNSTTTYGLTLAKPAKVSVDVFNTMGQKMMSMNYGTMSDGIHTMHIDASKLVSGVYFYTVHADGRTATKRFVVQQ